MSVDYRAGIVVGVELHPSVLDKVRSLNCLYDSDFHINTNGWISDSPAIFGKFVEIASEDNPIVQIDSLSDKITRARLEIQNVWPLIFSCDTPPIREYLVHQTY